MLTQVTKRAGELQVGRSLLWLLAVVPFLLGWLVGLAVRVIRIGIAACLIGYEKGAGTVKNG